MGEPRQGGCRVIPHLFGKSARLTRCGTLGSTLCPLQCSLCTAGSMSMMSLDVYSNASYEWQAFMHRATSWTYWTQQGSACVQSLAGMVSMPTQSPGISNNTTKSAFRHTSPPQKKRKNIQFPSPVLSPPLYSLPFCSFMWILGTTLVPFSSTSHCYRFLLSTVFHGAQTSLPFNEAKNLTNKKQRERELAIKALR